MKVRVYITAYNRPEFIDLQVETFQRHCKDDYELFIINNSNTPHNTTLTIEKCNQYNLRHIEVSKKSNAELCSQSHAEALEYTLNHVIRKEPADINVIFDNDIFPYQEFSFEKLLNGNLLGGIYQQRGIYNYIAAIFIMMSGKLDLSRFSFHSGIGDTGSGVQSLMNDFNISPKYVNHTAKIDIEKDHIFKCQNIVPYEESYRCQFIGDVFIHFYRGSSWDGYSERDHCKKFEFLINFLNRPESYCLNLDEYVNYPTAHSDKGRDGADNHYHNYRFIDMKKPS